MCRGAQTCMWMMFPTIIISSSTISSANSNFQEKQVGYAWCSPGVRDAASSCWEQIRQEKCGGLVQYSKWGYCCNSTGVQKEDLNQLPSALHQSALWEITSQHKDRPEAQHSKAVASNKNIVDKNRGDGVWATDYSIVSNKTLEKHTTGIQRNAECLDSYFIWVLGN